MMLNLINTPSLIIKYMTTLQELRALADEQEKFYEAMIKIEQKPQGIDIRCERPHCPFHLSYQEDETP